jgi:hypothetical protein
LFDRAAILSDFFRLPDDDCRRSWDDHQSLSFLLAGIAGNGGNGTRANAAAMAERNSHRPAQVCRQRAEQLKGLAMAESYPERRKHFFDLAAAYRNAASMMEPQVTDGATRDSDFWSSTVL